LPIADLNAYSNWQSAFGNWQCLNRQSDNDRTSR
jgi:hypothetical protein